MGSLARALKLWWDGWLGRPHNDPPPKKFVDHTLADAVLSRADPTSVRDQVQRDMLRMMQHFSVDPAELPSRFSDALRDAERVCAHCLSVGRCQRWLHGQLSDGAPRSFCPNAQLYDEIAVSQQQAADSNEPPTA
jgi:hypothetical protein